MRSNGAKIRLAIRPEIKTTLMARNPFYPFLKSILTFLYTFPSRGAWESSFIPQIDSLPITIFIFENLGPRSIILCVKSPVLFG